MYNTRHTHNAKYIHNTQYTINKHEYEINPQYTDRNLQHQNKVKQQTRHGMQLQFTMHKIIIDNTDVTGCNYSSRYDKRIDEDQRTLAVV
jgi:type IV secretory pathway VirB6-like protein